MITLPPLNRWLGGDSRRRLGAALMLSLSSPLARRASDDGSERSAESSLIGESRLKRHLRQRTSGAYQESLSPFDALQDEVPVWGRSKGLPERFREMTYG